MSVKVGLVPIHGKGNECGSWIDHGRPMYLQMREIHTSLARDILTGALAFIIYINSLYHDELTNINHINNTYINSWSFTDAPAQ